jgi:hypothetical protein
MSSHVINDHVVAYEEVASPSLSNDDDEHVLLQPQQQQPPPQQQYQSEADDLKQKFGYEQHLKRSLGLFSIFGVCTCIV